MIFGEKVNRVNVKQRSDGTWYCDITYADEGIFKLLYVMSDVISKCETALKDHNVHLESNGKDAKKK